MHLQTDVCIIGGGPAGMLLGYLLVKNGVSVIVLERSGSVDREFRGEHITAETEFLLNEHGLFDQVKTAGILEMAKVEYFFEGALVKTIKPAGEKSHVGIHVPQANLLTAMRKASSSFPNYQLLMNATVTGLIQDRQGVYTGVEAKQNGNVLTVTSSAVVGADGRFSAIRKLAHIKTESISHGYDVLWAKIPAPRNWEPTTRMLLVEGHQLALFTQAGGWIQIGWNIKKNSYSDLRKTSLQPLLEPLVKSFPELTNIVRQYLHSWKQFVCLKVESSRSDTWVKDGLVIIGDAAHTMTPTGALGINCAIKDAHVLAPILQDAVANQNTSAAQLKLFEQRRRSEVETQQKKQIDIEQSFRSQFLQPAGV